MNGRLTRSFGHLPDGQEVDIYTLGSEDGLQAEILTLGGTLRSLSLPPLNNKQGKRIPLVLSLPDLPAYLKDTSYLGQLVGRYGNRIAGAAFELEGKQYKLTANNGPNLLHGGEVGFGKYVWKVLGSGGGRNTYLKLGHRSPAGINGFPGNLDVTALISVYENTLTLAYEATTDAPTPISLTWHPYFTLSGDPAKSIDEQRLMMNAGHYLPINENARAHGRDRPRGRHAIRFPQAEERARAATRLASADRAHRRLRPLLGDRRRRTHRRLAAFAREWRAHAGQDQPAWPAGIWCVPPEDRVSGVERHLYRA